MKNLPVEFSVVSCHFYLLEFDIEHHFIYTHLAYHGIDLDVLNSYSIEFFHDLSSLEKPL